MDFSVVIPAYNGELTIAASVLTALQQAHLHEVIIVDDGSNDSTSEVVRSLSDPRVHFLQQRNAGPAAARNTGAEAASGSHLLFLDADDRLLPNALSTLAVVHGRGYQLARASAVIQDGDSAVWTRYSVPSDFPYPRGAPLAGTFSIDRALFESVGRYDDKFHYGENSELLFRAQLALLRAGEAAGFTDDSTMQEVIPSNRSDLLDPTNVLNAAVRMLQKHGKELRDDPVIYANHHAIVSHHYQKTGHRLSAAHHAILAARAQPTSVRSWARIPLSFAPPRRRRRREQSS